MKQAIFQTLLKCSLIIFIFYGSAQATSIKPIFRFIGQSETPTITPNVLDHYIENDWNPSDGDTHWISVNSGNISYNQLELLDIIGSHASAKFTTDGDLWETVSIVNPNSVPDLTGTQEIQLSINPSYSNKPQYISILLRLTMVDGSFWDQTKSFINNGWQKGVFSTKPHEFIRPEWSVAGEFNLSNVISWEIILVDLPAGEHTIKLHSLLMKGNYEVIDQNISEPFNVTFPAGESSILFLKNDSNHDGDTQWLYHYNKIGHLYSTSSYTEAAYRFEGDENETISIKKESQSYFDLSNMNRIVARARHLVADQPNAYLNAPLIMKLTMEDGSVWKKESQNVVSANGAVDYIFSIDNQGDEWELASSEFNNKFFNSSQIQAWELVIHGIHTEPSNQYLQKVFFYHIHALKSETSLLSDVELKVDDWNPNDGDMAWLSSVHTFGDGLVAQFSSGGDPWDSVSIHPRTPIDVIQKDYTIDIQSSYANPLPDAVTLQLTMIDGSLWRKSISLPVAGRYIHKFRTRCHSRHIYLCSNNLGWTLAPWGPKPTNPPIPWGPTPFDSPFDASRIVDWKIILNTPPAGEHNIHLRLHR